MFLSFKKHRRNIYISTKLFPGKALKMGEEWLYIRTWSLFCLNEASAQNQSKRPALKDQIKKTNQNEPLSKSCQSFCATLCLLLFFNETTIGFNYMRSKFCFAVLEGCCEMESLSSWLSWWLIALFPNHGERAVVSYQTAVFMLCSVSVLLSASYKSWNQ